MPGRHFSSACWNQNEVQTLPVGGHWTRGKWLHPQAFSFNKGDDGTQVERVIIGSTENAILVGQDRGFVEPELTLRSKIQDYEFGEHSQI